MTDTIAEEYNSLARNDQKAFLEKIAFSGPLSVLASNIEFSFFEGMIKSNWAMNPARDGFNAQFNPFAGFKNEDSAPLKSSACAFVALRSHPFEKPVRDSLFNSHWEPDSTKLTPKFLSEVITHAVEVSRALDKRSVPGDDCGILDTHEQSDLLEKVILPLLHKMEPAPR